MVRTYHSPDPFLDLVRAFDKRILKHQFQGEQDQEYLQILETARDTVLWARHREDQKACLDEVFLWDKQTILDLRRVWDVLTQKGIRLPTTLLRLRRPLRRKYNPPIAA